MSQTIIGKGTVYGAVGQDDFFGAASVKYQSFDLKDDFDKKYLKDEYGNVIGVIGANGKKEISIDLVPAAAPTGGIAAAEAMLKVPGKVAKVVLSAFRMTTLNGNWLYEGGATLKWLNDDVCKITIPLCQYDADVTAAVT